jgi:hypothetical protein
MSLPSSEPLSHALQSLTRAAGRAGLTASQGTEAVGLREEDRLPTTAALGDAMLQPLHHDPAIRATPNHAVAEMSREIG